MISLSDVFYTTYHKHQYIDFVEDSNINEMEVKLKEIKDKASKLTDNLLKTTLVKEAEELFDEVKKNNQIHDKNIDAYLDSLVLFFTKVGTILKDEKKDIETLKNLHSYGETYQKKLKSYQGKLSPEQTKKINDLNDNVKKLQESIQKVEDCEQKMDDCLKKINKETSKGYRKN